MYVNCESHQGNRGPMMRWANGSSSSPAQPRPAQPSPAQPRPAPPRPAPASRAEPETTGRNSDKLLNTCMNRGAWAGRQLRPGCDAAVGRQVESDLRVSTFAWNGTGARCLKAGCRDRDDGQKRDGPTKRANKNNGKNKQTKMPDWAESFMVWRDADCFTVYSMFTRRCTCLLTVCHKMAVAVPVQLSYISHLEVVWWVWLMFPWVSPWWRTQLGCGESDFGSGRGHKKIYVCL